MPGDDKESSLPDLIPNAENNDIAYFPMATPEEDASKAPKKDRAQDQTQAAEAELEDGETLEKSFVHYQELYHIALGVYAERPKDEDSVRLVVHCGAVLLALACDLDQIALAEEIMQEIWDLVPVVVHDAVCRESIMTALSTLVIAHADSRQLPEAHLHFLKMVSFWRQGPSDLNLIYSLGETIAALIVDYQQLNDETHIVELLNILSELTAASPEIVELLMWLGRGALALIGICIEDQKWHDAEVVAASYGDVLLSDVFAQHLFEEFGPEMAKTQINLLNALLVDGENL